MVAPEGFNWLEASQWVFIGLARVGLVGDRGSLKMMGGDKREEPGSGGWFDWVFGIARLAPVFFVGILQWDMLVNVCEIFFAFCPHLTIAFEFFLR